MFNKPVTLLRTIAPPSHTGLRGTSTSYTKHGGEHPIHRLIFASVSFGHYIALGVALMVGWPRVGTRGRFVRQTMRRAEIMKTP
jgi:hypothetical protein